MNQRTAKRLHDAQRAIGNIQRFVSGKSFADYYHDVYFQSAVERQFEVVSEALNLAEYDEIDHQIIWDTVHFDLPPLRIRIADLLTEFGLPHDE